MLGIIMAGGKGSRLVPLTDKKPKPLVKILGKPVIDYVKDALIKTGLEELIVTTGYKGEGLRELVGKWNEELSIPCSVNQENTPMGTAGSVKLLEDRLNNTFVVASGDAILSSNLELVIEAHRNSNALVTMALWEVDDPTQFGIVGLSEEKNGDIDANLSQGFITKFHEKPTADEAFSRVINAGLYVIEPEVMKHIPIATKYDFSKQLFPDLLSLGYPMYGIKLDGVWFDVGTPKEMIKAQNHLVKHSNTLPFELPKGQFTDDFGYQIGNSVTNSPISRSVLSDNSRLGNECKLIDSIVMSETIVGNNCTIIESIIGENVIIGNDCQISGSVIGDDVRLKDGTELRDSKISSHQQNAQDK